MKTIAREYRELLGANVLNDLDRVTAYFADLSKELTPKLRQRFCKDWNIPVKLFVEPYFSERLAVYNQQTFVAHLLGEFVRLVRQRGGEQYTACDTAEGCIYCGHQKLEKMDKLEPEESEGLR